MTEWIDVAVYAALVVVVLVALPAGTRRLVPALIADRDPSWLAEHPGLVPVIARSVWVSLSSAWGLVCLAALFTLQLGLWPAPLASLVDGMERWQALKETNTVLLLPGLALQLLGGGLFLTWLRREVPLAPRRYASLRRRSLDDFVPRGLRLAAYGFVGLVVLAWGIAGVTGVATGQIVWAQPLFVVVMTLIISAFVRLGVNRPPNAMDRILGPGLRAREVRVGFTMILWPAVMSAVRLFGAAAGTPLSDFERLSHLLLVLLVVLLALVLMRRWTDDPRPGGTPVPVLGLVAALIVTGPPAVSVVQGPPLAPPDMVRHQP